MTAEIDAPRLWIGHGVSVWIPLVHKSAAALDLLIQIFKDVRQLLFSPDSNFNVLPRVAQDLLHHRMGEELLMPL